MWKRIGLTFVVLAIFGLGFVAARRVESPHPEPPPVSARAQSRLPLQVTGQLTAQVATEGRLFHVYVGRIPGRGGEAPRPWSVAVPIAD